MDQITLKNFRCFREEQIARLALYPPVYLPPPCLGVDWIVFN